MPFMSQRIRQRTAPTSCLFAMLKLFNERRFRNSCAVENWNKSLSEGGNLSTAYVHLHNALTDMRPWDRFCDHFRAIKKRDVLSRAARLVAIAGASHAHLPDEELRAAGILANDETSGKAADDTLNWLLEQIVEFH